MDPLKTYPYFHKLISISSIITLLMIILTLFLHQYLFLYIALLSFFINVFLNHKYNEKLKKQLKHLIKNTDAIIERKPLEIIDGEGEISVLSHKLFILNQRYYGLIQQMKQEQIELKDYIENISHQLKTPITSMRINEELLFNHIENKKEKEKLNEIYIQTLKINQLVDDLLTLALIDSHSIQFYFQQYSLEMMINDIEEDLDFLLRKNHMTIQLHQDVQILCDKKWFEEAIKNIIKNCIEKNHNDVIDITINELETLIEIRIQDHGKGFVEEDIPHLFERFYRGIGQDYQGVGIGLALSKNIIEQHHGLIKASNCDGAVIDITLPKIFGKKKI